MRFLLGRPLRGGSLRQLAWLAPALLGVATCSPQNVGVRFEAVADANPPVVWPRPPEPPRVRLLASVARPADVGARRSFIRRMGDLLFGAGEPRRIRRPYGLAVDFAGRLYAADPDAGGVHLFDPEHGRYRFLSGAGGRRFLAPIGVTLDPDGNLYVSDPEQRLVFALDGRGRLRFVIGEGLQHPTGLAFHASLHRLYVVDTHAHQVLMYDTGGQKLGTFGGRGVDQGQFNFPTNVWIGADGNVYITDSMNFRVQVFTADGTFLHGFGRNGDGIGDLARPKGIATDSEGHVYVVEGLFDVVNVYDRTGRLLLSFGGAGRGRGEFWLATGLTIDAHDRIYVADSFNARIQVFQYLSASR